MGLGLTHYIPYMIYMGVFVVAFLTMFYRVELGLFFLVPLTPWQSIWFKLWEFPLGTRLIDILMVALLIGWFLRKKQDSEKTPFLGVILLLIIITFSGLFIGANEFPLRLSNPYFKEWKNFIYMPLLYLITVNNIREERHMKILLFLMALSMLANDFYFKTTFKWIDTYHFSNKERTSIFIDLGPNEMASFVSQGTMFLLGIWLTYKEKWSWRIIAIAGIILANFYLIIYSYSRGAYLAVLISLLFFGLIKNRKILLIVGLLFVVWTSVLPTSVVERINMTQNQEGQLDNASEVRLLVWREGLNTFASNPLGVGFDRFKSQGLGDTGKRDAHNMFIKMLVELGIQGLGIYILLYILGLRSGWSLYKSGDNEFLSGLGLGFMACVLTTIITNSFGQSWLLFTVTSYYWVFWALVARANIIVRERAEIHALEPAPLQNSLKNIRRQSFSEHRS